MEIKFIIIIILLYTIFLEFYPPFSLLIFRFLLSADVSIFFSLRPLPIDKAGCHLILYHIPDMLEELWVKNIIFRAIPSQTQQGRHVQDRESVCV